MPEGRDLRSRPRRATCCSFGANEALKDDGQIFSCDLTPHGKQRKVYTLREPLLGVISRDHAVQPPAEPGRAQGRAVDRDQQPDGAEALREDAAVGAAASPTCCTRPACRREMLSVVTGDPREIADELITNADVDLVTFTGGVPIGKYIAAKAGYRRMVLELGGNDPIIVMEDADLDEAATLAAQGSYKNSGQRCTAVKRMLVHETVADALRRARGREDARRGRYGDPTDPSVDMGTVIDEAAAQAVRGARQRGGRAGRAPARRQPARRRALLADRDRPRRPGDDAWCARRPSARSRRSSASSDIDEAIRIVNGTAYGLSSAVCTNRLDYITRFVAELHVGTRQRPRGAGLPAGADAVRRHQGFGPRLQGRRAGGDEELHQRQDLLAALGLRRPAPTMQTLLNLLAGDRAAGLGHAHRAHRHAARVRREPAARPAAQLRQPLPRVPRRASASPSSSSRAPPPPDRRLVRRQEPDAAPRRRSRSCSAPTSAPR